MQVVVQYSKIGSARYVSHLDTLRMMQRAFRRAQWPLAYSQGYHPHPQMSFAMALPVGAQALADLMQVELAGSPEPEVLLARLKGCMPPGFDVSSLAPIPDKTVLTTLVSDCDWYFTFPDADRAQVEAFAAYLKDAESLPAVKTSGKKPGKQVDCRPGMDGFEVTDERDGIALHLRLRASQEDYVQPALVMSLAPEVLKESAWELTRGTLYTTLAGERMPLLSAFKGSF